jgi:hypothetical protein
MLRTVFAVAVAGLVLAAVSGTAKAAQPAARKYCLQGPQWGFPGNCQFSSRRQCMASASGTIASCGINPRYAR